MTTTFCQCRRGWVEKMVDTAELLPSAPGSGADTPPASSSRNTQLQQRQQEQLGTSTSAAAGGDEIALRMVLSPGPTPASSLLVPIRLKGMEPQQAVACRELEVSGD